LEQIIENQQRAFVQSKTYKLVKNDLIFLANYGRVKNSLNVAVSYLFP
jgi:hypothetical protein